MNQSIVTINHSLSYLILSIFLLSCTNPDKSSSPDTLKDTPPFIVTVNFGESLNSLYVNNSSRVKMYLEVDGGSKQIMTTTENQGALAISGLPNSLYNVSISIEFSLPGATIPIASFDGQYQLTDDSRTLTISPANLIVSIHDADIDGTSNLEELLAGSNPLGTNILITSPAEYTVTNMDTEITHITAYAPNANRPLFYTITSGQDQDKFLLDSESGRLSFVSLPQLKTVLSENQYHVTISVSDGIESADLDILIYVADPFVISVSSQFKAIEFNWQAIDNAHTYQILEKPESAADFRLLQSNISLTSYRHPISLHLFNNKTLFKIEAVDAGAKIILSSMEFRVTDKLLDSIGIFKDIPSKSFSNFGDRLSISADGKMLAIGSRRESYLPLSTEDLFQCGVTINYCEVGGVHLFSLVEDTWVSQIHLTPITSDYGAHFGADIGLSDDGKTLVVGVPGYDVANIDINGNHLADCDKDPAAQTNCNSDSGAVFVYQQAANTWTLSAILKADNSDINDGFGRTATISGDGNTIAVAAPYEDSAAININGLSIDDCEVSNPINCANNSGASYIYRRQGNDWIQQAYIKASNPRADLLLGFKAISLSDDGNTLVVTTHTDQSAANTINGPQIDDCDVTPIQSQKNCAKFSGAVYVYRFANDTWLPPTYIKSINTEEFQYFGAHSLSGDGLTLAIGATGENGGSTGINGNPENDCSVNVLSQSNCALRSGAAYIYRYNGSEWKHIDYIKPVNTHENMGFGIVALNSDGTHLAIGAIGEYTGATGVGDIPATNCDPFVVMEGCIHGSGAVYYYHFDGVQWSTPVFIKAPDPEFNDLFGYSIAISQNGSALLISAPLERSIASGFNDPSTGIRDTTDKPESGAVYIY